MGVDLGILEGCLDGDVLPQMQVDSSELSGNTPSANLRKDLFTSENCMNT